MIWSSKSEEKFKLNGELGKKAATDNSQRKTIQAYEKYQQSNKYQLKEEWQITLSKTH